MSGAAELREQLEQLTHGNKELKAQIKTKTFEYALRDAGFDPESGEAKAIVKTYNPDAEVTPEALAEYAAEEFGFTPAPQVPDEQTQQELIAHMRAEGEARLAMVNAGTIPVSSGEYGMSLQDKARRAEGEGDWETVDRLNAEMLERARQTHPEYRSR